jgi:hypothetical protein
MTESLEVHGARLRIFRDAPSLEGLRTAALGEFSCEAAQAGARAIREAMVVLKAEGFGAVLGPMDENTWGKHRLGVCSLQSTKYARPSASPTSARLKILGYWTADKAK